jgi:hypothetical protein
VRPWEHRPSLAGLDRHIAQSAICLSALQAHDNGSSRITTGTSQVVADEPYRMAFAMPPGWRLHSVKTSTHEATIVEEPATSSGLLFLTLKSPKSGDVHWTAEFLGPSLPVAAPRGTEVVTNLRIAPRRGDLHLTWDPTPGAAYYLLACNGAEVLRTSAPEAWDRPTAADATYRVTACDVLGRAIGKSEEVKPVLPAAVTPPKPEVYLTDLKPVSAKQGWGELHLDQSVEGHPITVAGRKFDHGLGTHAVSEIVYDLGGKSGKFVGWVGVDDEIGGAGTVAFRVSIDDRQVWESDVLERGDAPVGFVVPFEGAHTLKLVVDDGGDGINYDHADWADVGLIWKK